MAKSNPPPDSYSIWIVSPPGYSHSRCFEELALGLRDALIVLGYAAQIVTAPDFIKGQTIILGANLLTGHSVPPHAIIFNLEQVSAESEWFGATYLPLLRRHRVWDYSGKNISALAGLGITAAFCGIGYMPVLTRIANASFQDIDVLFIGSLNQRRALVLQELEKRGVKVVYRFNVYGAERDFLFSRAKIVLNIHYYEAKILEMVRVSYLLANRICVVSETGDDESMEEPYRDGIAFSSYENLTETCLRLLADNEGRMQLGSRGFGLFSARSQVEMLKAALRSDFDSLQ